MRVNFNENKGITLIALVVTIIVILILAGISVSMLTGQNGILNRASEAKEKTDTANKDEQRKLAQAEALMSTEKTTYKGVTLPEGFAPTKIEGEDSIDDGLVITDGYGNEYVWVEVPKADEVYQTAGLSITAFTDEEYGKIEDDLHTYTSDYRNGTSYKDEYYPDSTEGWFKDEKEYNDLKNKMLKSIYQNKGFWVGRYEVGYETNEEIRNGSDRYELYKTTQKPVIKANVYPYNWIRRAQAQKMASNIESGNCTSSLMFGVQWDLILKFIEEKTVKNSKDTDKEKVRENIIYTLNTNSVNIGNYSDNKWNVINSNAKYSIEFRPCPYKKEEISEVILTTGASDEFSEMNIYDLAGNMWEITLERTSDENSWNNVMRGGSFAHPGNTMVANYRNIDELEKSYPSVGFRVVLY